MFGATDRTATATYHFRPFGRPQIEAYFGGRLAKELEAGGEHAFLDFALSQLTGLLGSAFRDRVKPIRIHGWSSDPYSRGSYSYARPGMADCRMRALLDRSKAVPSANVIPTRPSEPVETTSPR